jgi:hypothetical protein
VAFAVGRKGGMAGRALEEGEGVDSNCSIASVKGSYSGEDGLLAFAGGRPVGVEGGALFFPLRGVVDMVYE